MEDSPLDHPPALVMTSRAPDQAYSLRWWLCLWVPLSGVIVFGIARLAFGPGALSPDGHLMTISSLWLYLALLVWLITSARRSGLSLRETFGPRPHVQWLPEVGLVAWLHLQLNAALFLMALAIIHHWLPEVSRSLGDAGAKAMSFGSTPAWLQWVVIVGLAPITEEWLFRGVLHHRFARRFGAGRAQLLTSAMFALLHMNPFGVFALGMMLQALYRRSRSLTTCILAHALNNAVPLTLLLWGREAATPSAEVKASELQRIANLWPAWVLMSAALIALLLWHLRGRWPARHERTPWAFAADTRDATRA